MRLQTLQSWAETEYVQPPDRKTLINHAQELGLAVKRGGMWYIDTMRKNSHGLPRYMSRNSRGDGFRYYLPNGKQVALSQDESEAIEEALMLNKRYGRETLLDSRIRNAMGEKTIKDACELYLAEFLQLDRAKNTKDIRRRQVARIIRDLGDRPLTISRRAIAEWLNFDTHNHYRAVLIEVFRIAVAEGWIEENEAEKTRKKVKPKKQRPPMTEEMYKIIYNSVEDWLQIAMDLSLYTTQRVGDVLKMKTSDIVDGKIRVIQQKTGGPILVGIGPQLGQVIDRARSYPVASPYLVRRVKRKHDDNGPKPVKLWTLEHYFRKSARELMDPHPTFHEIRGLGITLARNAGLDAQTLAGHSDKSMTDKYDHEIRFKEAGTL